MLARALKPNCDGLHDGAKRLLIWAFKGKRKFSSSNGSNTKFSRFDDEDDSYSYNKRRRPNFRNGNFNDYGGFSKKKINWDGITLKPFTKNFYSPHPDVLNRSQSEINEFLERHDIKIKGRDIPAPIFSFEEAGLSDKMIALVRQLNYSEPTAIQAMGWPIALSGRNMVGVARTGSGKTLGFVLPAVIHIQHQPPLESGDGPIALVLAPTRELVQQTHNVAASFGRASDVRAVSVYGGSDRYSQERQLRRGAQICIATPGRLLDFLRAGATNLERCTYLVLDEADRMFDMGFEPQIRDIIEQIRPDRQVLMWSATWPKEVRSLAEEYLDEYIRLNVGSLELTANPNINQVVHICNEGKKKTLLKEILETVCEENSKVLVFAATKIKVDDITYWLNSIGHRADGLHGGKTQRIREAILKSYRNGRIKILVATDVAARGLDVSDIKYVINYDCPHSMEDYIHRIGRTGRHNATGTSHTFFTEQDSSKAKDLINVLRDANQNVIPELMELASYSGRRAPMRGYGQRYNTRRSFY